jgi:hypothetical protein
MLFTVSGFVSFGSSYFIKLIRDSQMPSNMKYFYIFGAAAIALIFSILCFIPLKETVSSPKKTTFDIKEYIKSLIACYKTTDYKKLIRTRFFAHASMILNAFLFIYASNSLKLSTNLVSNLIIYQTVGIIVGGIITGQVSARFGVKRMLLLMQINGLLIPILALVCLIVKNPYIPISLCILISGFNQSGKIGYGNYLIEVIEKEKVILHMAANQLVLFPLSFLSAIAGIYIQSHTMTLIFIFQIVVSCIAIFMCLKLRLVKRN